VREINREVIEGKREEIFCECCERRQRDQFEKRGDPILSVDAKKTELIGNFKNPSVKWEPSYTEVNDHDFRSAAQGIGTPLASTTPRPTAAV
jgi:hypothetical protein